MIKERIFAEGLTKRFDGFTAVDSVSFQVNAGEVLVLLGPNGAGKTTTVRMLTSVLRPTSGQARLAGFDVLTQPERVRASVGVLTEHHGLYSRMAAPEYLLFFAQLYDIPARLAKARIDILLERFGLGGDRSKRLGEYSKGMRQKLALVRAMIHEPPVLLLDEPTSAMDPESAHLVRQAIRSMRSTERGLILCTHNLPEAEELADQIAIIRRGKIILLGPLDQIKQNLLGMPEFEVRLAAPLDGRSLPLLQGVEQLQSGLDWIRLRVPVSACDEPNHSAQPAGRGLSSCGIPGGDAQPGTGLHAGSHPGGCLMSLGTQLRPAFLVTRREVRDQFRDWRIILPILGLTVIFPILMNFTARQALNFVEQYGAPIIAERMVPFLLMIVGFFPITSSMVFALDSFVGEKERGSIEPLLNTPLKDWQIYLGKLLSSTIPPLLGSFLAMLVYILGLLWKGIALPSGPTLIQIFVITIVQALVMVSAAVVVSSQATSIRSSNMLSAFIIIPAALLIQGESILMFWGTNDTLWWAVIGLMVLTILLVRVGLAHFRREELLGRELDVLNIRWGWGVFWKAFSAGARSPGEWYRTSIVPTIRRLRLPAALLFVLMIVFVWIGIRQAEVFVLPVKGLGVNGLQENLNSVLGQWSFFSISPVMGIWWQNVRVLILGMGMGIFTFGVLGILPVMISTGLAGYLVGTLAQGGQPVFLYITALILPHGIFELSAALLASSAVFYMGAVLATPDPARTIGEIWLEALADWCKVMAGVVIPMLLVAAAIEAWVTPRIALALLGG